MVVKPPQQRRPEAEPGKYKKIERKLRETCAVAKLKEIPLSLVPAELMARKKKLISKFYGSEDNFRYLERMARKNKWA